MANPNKDTLNRYVQQKLSDEEEAEVELWVMDNPSVVGELEIGVAMREALQAIDPKPEFAPSLLKPSRPWYRAFAGLYFASGAVATFAAGLVTVTALSWNGYSRSPETAIANVPIVRIEAKRAVGDNASSQLRLPPDSKSVHVLVQLVFPEAPSFSVEIRRDDSPEVIATIDQLIPTSVGTLSFVLDARILEPGFYVISVKSEAGEQQDLTLDVLAQSP